MDDMAKLSHQEIAEQVLQIYIKAIQNHKHINGILAEYSILDYFGTIYYKKDKIAPHLFANLHGSICELSSFSINDSQGSVVEWEPLFKAQKEEMSEENLGVNLITSPKLSFPSVSLSTPIHRISSSSSRKHTSSENSQALITSKKYKNDFYGEQSSSCQKSDNADFQNQRLVLSPERFGALLPDDIKYLTAYVTIRHSNSFLPSMDPKKKRLRSLYRLCDRFCQLQIGFECGENVFGVTNCKIWTIKYSVSSRVTPRNLLNAFNEVE